MRIVHVATAKSWRGGEQQVMNLFSKLKDSKVEQLLVCSKGSEIERRFKNLNFEYISIEKSSGFDLGFARGLYKAANNFKADLIHLHDAHAHTAAVLASDIFGNKVRLVLSRRVDFKVKPNILSKYKYNHKLIKRIICVSKKIREITLPSIHEKDKVIVVYSGINTERFHDSINRGKLKKELNLSDDFKIIGNTAAISDHKDYPTFVRTAVHFKEDEKVSFVIMGDGPDRIQIEQLIKEKNLQSKIHLIGFREDLPDLLPEFDVFLMTSKSEGLGTSLFDAMACKVPIIATNAGGIPEIVEDQVNGLTAEVGDDSKMATLIRQLLNNEDLKKQLVNAGVEKLNLFSSERMAKETLAVYQTILNPL